MPAAASLAAFSIGVAADGWFTSNGGSFSASVTKASIYSTFSTGGDGRPRDANGDLLTGWQLTLNPIMPPPPPTVIGVGASFNAGQSQYPRGFGIAPTAIGAGISVMPGLNNLNSSPGDGTRVSGDQLRSHLSRSYASVDTPPTLTPAFNIEANNGQVRSTYMAGTGTSMPTGSGYIPPWTIAPIGMYSASSAASEVSANLAGHTRVFTGCFAAGTPVLTPDGDQPIESLKVGDRVYARPENSADAPAREQIVEEVFRSTAAMLALHIQGKVIETTAEHPFFVVGQGWVPASRLQPDDELISLDGHHVRVDFISPTNRYQSVYNVRISQDHTYFIGAVTWGFSVWAHNAECAEQDPDVGEPIGSRPMTSYEKELYDRYNGGGYRWGPLEGWLHPGNWYRGVMTGYPNASEEYYTEAIGGAGESYKRNAGVAHQGFKAISVVPGGGYIARGVDGVLVFIEGDQLHQEIMDGAPAEPARMREIQLPVENADQLPEVAQELLIEGGADAVKKVAQQKLNGPGFQPVGNMEKGARAFLVGMRNFAPFAIIVIDQAGKVWAKSLDGSDIPPAPNSKGRELFRTMQKDSDGFPHVPMDGDPPPLSNPRRGLGYRPNDIPVINDRVAPGDHGLSTAIGSERHLNDAARPTWVKDFDGKYGDSKDPLFKISEDKLGPDLVVNPDLKNEHHGLVGPAREMWFEDLKRALKNTREKWIEVRPIPKE